MTNKNKILLLTALLLASLLIIFFSFYQFNSKLKNLDFHIFDSNDNNHYEQNEVLEFFINDSSAIRDKTLIWHFGNGDTLRRNQNIKYKYKEPGKYLVTVNIDNTNKISKYIKVISTKERNVIDSIPKLFGPDDGYVGEELVFTSQGPGIETWYWEFGETGSVDSYEKQTVYVYTDPGVYNVKLTTNTTQYPLYHTIRIMSRFEKFEGMVTQDSLALAENDIKKHLQALADTDVSDRKTFNELFNYIKNTYTCGAANEVVVVINDNKYNDLYSFCQGLHYLDSKRNQKININKIELETFKCIKRINVTQSMLK
ncbi:PKD domain-containing protein [Mariniflexile ostreae]|uniref:PKD domain-containing protein n=1 Tax=Mariniflexile ostreae TaxID=1520892 RepID=A0ABV5FA20_9FLAO